MLPLKRYFPPRMRYILAVIFQNMTGMNHALRLFHIGTKTTEKEQQISPL